MVKEQLHQRSVACQRLEDGRHACLAQPAVEQVQNTQTAAACNETRQALAGCSLHGRRLIRQVSMH